MQKKILQTIPPWHSTNRSQMNNKEYARIVTQSWSVNYSCIAIIRPLNSAEKNVACIPLAIYTHVQKAFLTIDIFFFQLYALSVKRINPIFWDFQFSHSGMTSVWQEHNKLLLTTVYCTGDLHQVHWSAITSLGRMVEPGSQIDHERRKKRPYAHRHLWRRKW